MNLSSALIVLLASLTLAACGGGDSPTQVSEQKSSALVPKLLPATTVGSVTTFSGTRANYTIVASGTTVTVTDKVGADGTVTLNNPSRLLFADAGVAFDLGGTAGKAYRLYQAAFNRLPDAAGLGYWIEQVDKGLSVEAAAAQFIASAEFTAQYGAKPSNQDVIGKFYENVLHRKPDADGYAYWVGVLDNRSASVASVLAGFGESPENQAQVAAAIAAGINYTVYKPTPVAVPGVLSVASLSACPDASASLSKDFYKCMIGTAVGTTKFGTAQCILNIGSDGTMIMATKETTRAVLAPYYDAYYSKSTYGTADNFTAVIGASDTMYIGNTAMSGRQAKLQIVSPKNVAGKSVGYGIQASLDDLHCTFPL